MNHLNSSNSKDAITQIIQEILQEDPNYFLPKQFHVLSWKSKTVPNALITKVNGQRYLGLLRKDTRGQEYWKYKPLSNSENSGGESNSASVEVEQEKQATKELEQNPEVQKFREKFGTPKQQEIN